MGIIWGHVGLLKRDRDEGVNEQFPGPILDELDIHVFVDADHGHKKFTGIYITGLFFVEVSTPTTWLSKLHTKVKTSTFGAKLTDLKRDVKKSFMLQYHIYTNGYQGLQT